MRRGEKTERRFLFCAVKQLNMMRARNVEKYTARASALSKNILNSGAKPRSFEEKNRSEVQIPVSQVSMSGYVEFCLHDVSLPGLFSGGARRERRGGDVVETR
jgi:hypothetical protein